MYQKSKIESRKIHHVYDSALKFALVDVHNSLVPTDMHTHIIRVCKHVQTDPLLRLTCESKPSLPGEPLNYTPLPAQLTLQLQHRPQDNFSLGFQYLGNDLCWNTAFCKWEIWEMVTEEII